MSERGQVIPALAVEAAAKVLRSQDDELDYPYPVAEYLKDARAILEAAAPHMLAAAWDEGSNSGYLWALKEGPWQEPGETAPANPYKTETP